MGVEGFELELPPLGGAADGLFRVEFRRPLGEHQAVPGVFPLGEGHQGKILRRLHGQILERVHREVRPAVPEGLVELPDEESLAADLFQGAIQDLVAGGLHGHQGEFHLGMGAANGVHDELALGNGQLALPASNFDRHGNSSNTLRMALAARAVRW